MEVASLVEGRMRIRDEGLKNGSLAAKVKEELASTPGVSSVEANSRVGSLLVLFSAAVTAVEKILEAVANILGSDVAPDVGGEAIREDTEQADPLRSLWGKALASRVSPAAPSILKRRILGNMGMLSSLALSLIAALFDLKKLHILSGLVFLALFGDHFYQRRARMFA